MSTTYLHRLPLYLPAPYQVHQQGTDQYGYGKRFVKEAVSNILKTNPFGKALLEAFEDTEKVMKGLDDKFQNESTRVVIDDRTIRRLRKLEGNEQLALPGVVQEVEDVIDAEFEMRDGQRQ